ncbi:MAG: FkbM family methyltransferase [Lachnospiraceae bacterium]|nr:FkbM family methyltransferase [Lachnospiraceae bacterium]
MKYLQKEEYAKLRKKYSIIIGWGAGVEFQRYYDHNILKFDYMIDGAERNIGKEINGITVEGIEAIAQYKEADSVLVVIFPNIENEIQLQISDLLPKADTIVARLLDIEDRKSTYASNQEDVIMLDYMLDRFTDFSYMDVGVCHPIVRNNTYLFYEKGYTNGVLVEPNAAMCHMAAEYRPLNKIVNFGASPVPTNKELTYYYDPMHPGLNTFLKDMAVSRGMEHSFKKIPMKDINTIISENFETYPNVLDLDTEGMDYELLSHLDFGRYPIEVICVEKSADGMIRRLLEERGYNILDVTVENKIYIRG